MLWPILKNPMEHQLQLKRPLAFFDLETTGIQINRDRIVEISIAKANLDGSVEVKTRRVNPGIPIPLEASLVHGIYDEDVKATKHNPAPGTYNPRTPDENKDRRITFGIGYRPKLDRPASRGIPSPGRYELKSTLGTRSFSFTHGVKKTRIRTEHTVGAICAQPTQFG